MDLLRKEGMTDVVMCTGYKGEMLESSVGDGLRFGIQARYSRDGSQLLGTGGALLKALPLLSDPFMVLYGDSYLVADYRQMLNSFLASRKQADPPLAQMTVFANEGKFDRSNVIFENGRVLVYDKKLQDSRMRHIDWGLGIVMHEAFRPFASRSAFDLAELYTGLALAGRLGGFEVLRRFYEIGSSEGIRDFESYLALSG